MKSPDYVAVDASRDRLELANQAGVLESGLDAADSIGAENSLEKMLAHQMATLHRSSMKMAAQVDKYVDRLSGMHPDRMTMQGIQGLTTETCRLANAVARMQGTFQQGMLTLQKLRTGGEQRVVVQHVQQVNVQEGGQALVAGEMKAGGGGRKRRGGRSENGQ